MDSSINKLSPEDSSSRFLASSMSYDEVVERNLTLGWNLEYRQLRAQEYKGYIACQEIGRFGIAIEEVAVKSELAGEFLGDEVCILLPSSLSGEAVYAQGKDICNVSALVLNSNGELDANVAGGSHVGQLYLSTEEFTRAWASLAPDVEPFQHQCHGFLDMPAGSMQAIVLKAFSLVHSEHTTALQQDEFVSWVLALLAEHAVSSQGLHSLGLSLPSRMRSLNRARDYIDARLGEPIDLSDLCAEIGASISTLTRMFKKYYGLSPTAYIKVRRLHECRKLLQLSHPAHASVASIMQSSGLSSHGRHSQEYRVLFGENPKHSLGYRGRTP